MLVVDTPRDVGDCNYLHPKLVGPQRGVLPDIPKPMDDDSG